jgi:NhaP-type Na+/H+ or K+/H+ antiporter
LTEKFIIGLSAIVVSGVLAQWIAWKYRFPSILLLLIFGFVAGPVTGFIDPDSFFGDLLFPFVSISVALILFEGGMNLKFSELKVVGSLVRNLITAGILITWILTTLGAFYILNFSFLLSVLFGAILVVTGPTVILPILRHVKPKGQINSILKWEGIVNDPIGALLAILVFEAVFATGVGEATFQVGFALLKSVIISCSIGLLGGYIIARLIKRDLIPDFLQNPASLTMVVLIFTASNLIQQESGLFSVTIMGIYLANQKKISIKHIIEFKENLRTLLISVLFIVLAARLSFDDLAKLNYESFIFVGALILVIRPISVFASSYRSSIGWKEKLFLSMMAPRGIVAAAVASVFSIELLQLGVMEGAKLVPEMFLVIVATITVYGLSAVPLAKWLGLSNLNPQGCLILGGHSFAREIAAVLKDSGYRILLVDTNRHNIREARMEGFEAHEGSATSESFLEETELSGIGKLLALTPNAEVNSLAALHLSGMFGGSNVYQLTVEEEEDKQGEAVSEELRGKILFGTNYSYYYLLRRFNQNSKIKSTPITEEYDYKKFLGENGGNEVVPMFLISRDKNLFVYTSENKPDPKPGQTLISLVPKDSQVERRKEAELLERKE